ncbi:hypothetical protein ACH5RR_029297 [Cinchona calisaya]|uniref:Uncharacterized protein n=1 Tax=Cinchona calisaya TaxID=153742 RepID=A0ABD2YSP6_9GENT
MPSPINNIGPPPMSFSMPPLSQPHTSIPFSMFSPISQLPRSKSFDMPLPSSHLPTSILFSMPPRRSQSPASVPFGVPLPTSQSPIMPSPSSHLCTSVPFSVPLPTRQAPIMPPPMSQPPLHGMQETFNYLVLENTGPARIVRSVHPLTQSSGASNEGSTDTQNGRNTTKKFIRPHALE